MLLLWLLAERLRFGAGCLGHLGRQCKYFCKATIKRDRRKITWEITICLFPCLEQVGSIVCWEEMSDQIRKPVLTLSCPYPIGKVTDTPPRVDLTVHRAVAPGHC